MTDLKTLKQLVKLMVDADLTELDIEGDNEKVKLRRGRGSGGSGGPSGSPEVHYVHAPAAQAPAAPVPAPVAQAQQTGSAQGGGAAEPEGPTIDSPMVGTFYSAASPDAKPFVSAGDTVGPDTVVCIIEAMKVFNEIKAEVSGTIEKVLVQNGQAVEFGQPLFVIKPG